MTQWCFTWQLLCDSACSSGTLCNVKQAISKVKVPTKPPCDKGALSLYFLNQQNAGSLAVTQTRAVAVTNSKEEERNGKKYGSINV